MASPKIGIIMPCFYSNDVVRKALTMLSWQSKKEEMEVILINDCSPNTNCDYQDLVQEFSTQLNLKYLKTERQGGPGKARQLGMDNCNCEWIMFHDDDDMLNTPYVIEAFIEAIESIPAGEICIEIAGPHLQFWNGASNGFVKTNVNFTGKLFNLNIIKFFDIRFPDLTYEEDALFATEYYYYINRLATFLPNVKLTNINIVDSKPNFISYTKQENRNSICGTQSEYVRTWRALDYLNALFEFYLSIPHDVMWKNVASQGLRDGFMYLQDWVSRSRQFEMNDIQRNSFIEMHTKFDFLVQELSNELPKDELAVYYEYANNILITPVSF